MDKAPNYLHVGCVIQKKPNFRKCAPELEGFLKQIEPAKMTNDDKDKFVQEMMLDFDKADLDKDGTINFSEYVRKVWGESEVTQEMPPTLRQLRRQFKRQDQNGDGKISRQEFEMTAEKCYFDLKK